jgi:hypothetical protein
MLKGTKLISVAAAAALLGSGILTADAAQATISTVEIASDRRLALLR